MKEFYIAPEVLIMCFAPVEELASNDWGTYAFNSNTPDTPDEEVSIFDFPEDDNELDGDG